MSMENQAACKKVTLLQAVKAEANFHFLVEGVLDYGIFMLDLNGNIISWNKGAERIKGYSEQEIVGKHFSIFYTPVDVQNGKPMRLLKTAKEEGRVEDEGWRVRKDGSQFWADVIISTVRDDKGNAIGFSKITRDLTDRKRAEEELRLTNMRLREHAELLDLAHDTIIVRDEENRILLWNKGAEKMYGWTKNEALGQITHSFLKTEFPASQEAIDNQLNQSEWWEGELVHTTQDGRKITVESRQVLHRSADNHSYRILEINMDITERKKLDQMKTEFVSFASHQLKTPLAELRGFIEVMLDGQTGMVNEKQKKYLQSMEKISVNGLRLVSDLLNASRLDRGIVDIRLRSMKLREPALAAIRVYAEQAKGKKLLLDLREEDKNVRVAGDFEKTTEVIKNILDNAVKFTDQGSITVTIRSDDKQGIIEIADTGVGIGEDILRQLFTKELLLNDRTQFRGGSGLGLYIAKKFMELQKGNITVSSFLGKGTTFTLTLPKEDSSELAKP